MKKLAFFAALAAVAVVGCNKQEMESPVTAGHRVIVKVTAENNPTRGEYNEEGKFIWADGDQIGVKMYAEDGHDYTPWTAPLTLTDGAGSTDGTFAFTGTVDDFVHYGVAAFYPYDGTTQPASNLGDDDHMYFFLPTIIEYEEGVNRMMLVGALEEDATDIKLYHAGAGIRISLKDVPARATKVVLTVEGKSISGIWTEITPADAGTKAATASESGESFITFNIPTADDVRDMVFTFPVPVQDYANARLTVTVADNNDTIWSKSGKIKTSPGRGEIIAMPELTVKDLAKTFYLVGSLNGADYFGQDYPFVEGKQTTWFTQESYVYIIDGRGNKYWFPEFVETAQEGTLYLWENQSSQGEMMKVPADAVLDLYLEDNGDNSLTLSYQIKDPAFVCDVPLSSYIQNYWNSDQSAVLFRVRVPSWGDTDPDQCVFENNLNAGFVIDNEGFVQLDNPDVTDIQYFFGAMEKQIVNGREVEFSVSEDGFELIAKKGDVLEVIATINNVGEDYAPNVVILNKNSSLAKELLSTGQFYVNLGAKGYLSGNPKLEGKITFRGKDCFRADYVRPIEIDNSSSEDYLEDGVELGAEHSYVVFDNFVEAKDWRGRFFSNYPNYWDYYGPFSVKIKDMTYLLSDGTSLPVPDDWGIKFYSEDDMYEALEGTDYYYSFPGSRLGCLVLQSKDASVKDCTLYVNVAITYGWGTIVPETFLVPIKSK